MRRSRLDGRIGQLRLCLPGSSQYIAADMQILWQSQLFRPLSVYSLCLSLPLSLSPLLSTPSSPVDVTVHPAYRGRAAQAVQQQQGEMQRAQRSSNGATLSPPVSFSFYHLPYPYSQPIPLSVSMPVSFSPCLAPEHKDKLEWRKTVPSYNQSAGAMDLRVWSTQDESQEPLPKNWEMAYTETGMVYFIE